MHARAEVAVLLSCLALPLPAAAQEAFTWVYTAHHAFDPADTSLDLIATQAAEVALADDPHLPRGLVWARCLPDAAGSSVAIRFEAFAGAAQAGDGVDFTLQGGGQGPFVQSAVIVNAGGDPTGGPEITVPAGGAEMALLASAPLVTFGVVGLDDFILTFDLSANQDYVAAFDTDCILAGGKGAAMGG